MNDTDLLTPEEQDKVTLLTAARALLQRGWTQHVLARTSDGTGVNGRNPFAVQWCLLGALGRAQHDLNLPDVPCYEVEHQLCQLVSGRHAPLYLWNNAPERTQEDVLALFDRALARYRK